MLFFNLPFGFFIVGCLFVKSHHFLQFALIFLFELLVVLFPKVLLHFEVSIKVLLNCCLLVLLLAEVFSQTSIFLLQLGFTIAEVTSLSFKELNFLSVKSLGFICFTFLSKTLVFKVSKLVREFSHRVLGAWLSIIKAFLELLHLVSESFLSMLFFCLNYRCPFLVEHLTCDCLL